MQGIRWIAKVNVSGWWGREEGGGRTLRFMLDLPDMLDRGLKSILTPNRVPRRRPLGRMVARAWNTSPGPLRKLPLGYGDMEVQAVIPQGI